ncbi:MAG: glycosyltransferase family 4 protein [Candidatus Binatia bacterium]
MKRLRILMSAYACEPGAGSEPGVGWSWITAMAQFHDVWAITRRTNRNAIERALRAQPQPRVRWIYVDLPRWAAWWERGRRGEHPYYYLWQFAAYAAARRAHRAVGFDVAHHLTFGMHWMPTLLIRLPVPLIWGPLGGGESGPAPFLRSFGFRGVRHELLRDTARWLGEREPSVRRAIRHAALILARSHETADRLRDLGARRVELCSEIVIEPADLRRLNAVPPRTQPPFRLLSVGRLLDFKGFHLGLEAFAKLQQQMAASEYWIVGDGRERPALEQLAARLAISRKVRFWGSLPRQAVFEKLAECDVLLHPSLHESGGWVTTEALAAGRPVIVLDLGGSAVHVTADTGMKIVARDPEQAVNDLADAMLRLAASPALRTRMGDMGRRHAAQEYDWSIKGPDLGRRYAAVVDGAAWRG